MGGLTSYALPEEVAPEGTVNISIYLQAPAVEGTATGYWRFQTPWGDQLWRWLPKLSLLRADRRIHVKPKYGITNLEYTLVRDPATGCPLNTRYYVYATVTASGPIEFSYYWDQSDGNESGSENLQIQRSWKHNLQTGLACRQR